MAKRIVIQLFFTAQIFMSLCESIEIFLHATILIFVETLSMCVSVKGYEITSSVISLVGIL